MILLLYENVVATGQYSVKDTSDFVSMYATSQLNVLHNRQGVMASLQVHGKIPIID
jgi:hypothetical protein